MADYRALNNLEIRVELQHRRRPPGRLVVARPGGKGRLWMDRAGHGAQNATLGVALE